VRCGRLLGKPAPESGTLWHADGGRGGHEGGRPLLEAANVYYPPPGVNGRMRRTGLAVHAVTSCARAAPAMSSTANAAPHLRTSLRFKRVRVSSP